MRTTSQVYSTIIMSLGGDYIRKSGTLFGVHRPLATGSTPASYDDSCTAEIRE
jgi:hypothetical protein